MDGEPDIPGVTLHDCWNKTGTWGKETPRCERLVVVGHCSKCEVYRGAGRILLQRPAPRGYLEEWREFLAARLVSGPPSGYFFVLFEISAQLYALPTFSLEQVTDRAPIRSLPHNRRPALLGVVNVRGDVLPCVDLAALLHPASSNSDRSPVSYRRLIVAKPGTARWVLPAEQVVGLQRLEPEQLRVDESDASSLLQGTVTWHARTVHVVSVERLAERLEGFKL